MNKRILSLTAMLLIAGTALAERPEKPNILLILADDLGWQDVKCYDIDEPSPMETPNIDALAEKGVMFWQGYSPAPSCAPTRCAILSGIHPARAQKLHVRGGMPPSPFSLEGSRLIQPWQRGSIAMEEPTIAEVLKDNGYTTGHSGKWHVNVKHNAFPLPKDVGFDWSREGFGVARDMEPDRLAFATDSPDDPCRLDKNGYPRNDIFEDSLTFLQAHKHEPFFFFSASRLVHSPIQSRSSVQLAKYCEKLGIPFPTSPRPIKTEGQTNPYYCAMVDQYDYYVGMLIDYLETTEDPRWPGHRLIENTYIIFTSDNGGMEHSRGDIVTDNYPLDEGKIHLQEGGVRVPLIISGPDIPAGVQTDVMANGLDFYPTILSMTSTKEPEGKTIDGCDLLPLLKTDPTNPDLVKEAIGEARDTMLWHFPVGVRMHSTIRMGGYKLLRNYDVIDNPNISEELELYQLYETKGGKSVRVDIEEASSLTKKMPEKANQMNARLTELLTEMKARDPYFNPTYDKPLPYKANVPTVLAHEQRGNTVEFVYEENGASVTSAELVYTTNGDQGVQEWFVAPARVDAPSKKVTAELPEKSTHYVLNLVDENQYLVSYPAMKQASAYFRKNKPSTDALKVDR